MKVVLINPNVGHAERIESEAAWPPLGLLYLGTILKNSGHDVKVIDNGKSQLPLKNLVWRVKREEPGVVGVGVLTPTFKQGTKIANAIKAELPDTKIVFGNYHATYTYDRILMKYPSVDYVVLGEGELSFPELVDSLEKGENVEKIPGLAFRKNGRVAQGPQRRLIDNLDVLPVPDRSLLEEEYRSEIMGVFGSSGRFTTVLTSRGCPYNCRYCACAAFSLRRTRFRSPEAVVAEIEMLCREGYEEVGFVDDNLLVNRKRMDKICDMLKEREIKMNYWAEGRVDEASREVLKKFAGVGCKTMYFGMESGSQKVLNYFGKNTTPNMAKVAVKNCKDGGIENVIGSFIVGTPIEDTADVRQTFDFAKSLKGMDFPQVNILCISPGMDLWNTAVKEGYLDESKLWEEELIAANVFPSRLTENQLREMIGKFYSSFVMRPPFLLQQMLKTVRSRHRMEIILANLHEGASLRAAYRKFRNT
ncbi:MAG: radical SAM protein [Candidatus Hadarchaeota archaeon]